MFKYLPVGIDPGADTCGVAIMHPNRDLLIRSFSIKNNSFTDVQFLIVRAMEVAKEIGIEKPVFVFEATNVFWRPLFSYLSRNGYVCHTVPKYRDKPHKVHRDAKDKDR